jgi:drug/metabolite transporter (DMT)-like permease
MAEATAPRALKNDFAGWAIVAFASMLWGTDVLLRPMVLAAGLDSVAVVLLEHAALTILFLPVVVKARRELFSLNLREFLALLFISWAGSMLATVLLTQAYVAGDPLTATLLQKLQPAFAIVLAGPVLKEQRKAGFWLWFAMALIGAYLLSFGLSWVGDPFNRKGLIAAVYAVSAAAIWGTCTVVGRWSLTRLNPLPMAGLRFTLALPLLLLWALLGNHLATVHQSQVASAIIPLLLIVVFPDVLGMSLYYLGLERTSASLATLAELAYPATAIIVSLGSTQEFTKAKWFGIVLILVSLFFIRGDQLVKAPSDAVVAEN